MSPRVAVVAEIYPRPQDPAWGIWAHRQAVAVREEGIDVSVVALERPLPSLNDVRALPNLGPLANWGRRLVDRNHRPRKATLDGIPVRYARFLSPPRPLSYWNWGRWAARPVARALEEVRRERPIDLVHVHYAVPGGDATLRWMRRRGRIPLVVSVHGGDLSYTAARSERGRRIVTNVLRSADAVIANSEVTRLGIEELTGSLPFLEVIHPGADLPPDSADERQREPTLVTVAHLEEHKNQGAVIRALAALTERHPALRYELIGKGPDRAALEELARTVGVGERVSFLGPMSHDDAMSELAHCHVHVMPSVHEAFGVAHVEAMAAGLPTIGGAGTGAEDVARLGEGMILVPSGDLAALVRAIDALVSDERERSRLGEAARRTAAEHFTWARNGAETAALYRRLLSGGPSHDVTP
jgi:teichuronic acid biosynthesis glycosyltransferase TuaC